jgi:hypothetical protein
VVSSCQFVTCALAFGCKPTLSFLPADQIELVKISKRAALDRLISCASVAFTVHQMKGLGVFDIFCDCLLPLLNAGICLAEWVTLKIIFYHCTCSICLAVYVHMY